MPDDPRYNTRRWQDTRRKARERDGNCCVVCGSIRNLSVDHIVAITDDPSDENFYNLDGCRTLCSTHHTRKSGAARRRNRAGTPARAQPVTVAVSSKRSTWAGVGVPPSAHAPASSGLDPSATATSAAATATTDEAMNARIAGGVRRGSTTTTASCRHERRSAGSRLR